jgi:branched-chain amino acid aminotransferase
LVRELLFGRPANPKNDPFPNMLQRARRLALVFAMRALAASKLARVEPVPNRTQIHYLACFRAMGVLHARIDGISQSPDQARISVADEGLLRGDGVFEVLRLYAGSPFAVDQHLDRMRRSADGLRLPFNPEAALSDVVALSSLAEGSDALIRLIQTRGGRLIALLESAPELPASVQLATITYSPSGILDGMKTISYAANALATRLANDRGADEALFATPDGRVLEGPNFAAFFAFSEDTPLCTSPLHEGILDSITRRCVMDLVPTVERRIRVAELSALTEAFVVSTVREVLPVSRVDNVSLQPAPGRLTATVAALFSSHVHSQPTSLRRAHSSQPDKERPCPTVGS